MLTLRQNRSISFLDIPFWVFTGLTVLAGILCLAKGASFFLEGVQTSYTMFWEVIPRLVPAFIIAGFVEVLAPRKWITKWVGRKSGLKGIAVATCGGIVTPGGPMVSFPLISSLYSLGADIGPLIAYLTAWSVLGAQRILVWEIPFMGTRFALLRFCVSLILPLIAAFIAQRFIRLQSFAAIGKTQ